MAKILDEKKNPANPDLFGEDIVDLLVMGGGIAGTAVGNDRFIAPVVRQIIPGATSGLMGSAVNAASAAGTAWLVGEAVALADRRLGRLVRRGGLVYAVAVLAGAVLPGYSLSSLPVGLPLLGAAPRPALPAGNGALIPANMRLGVGSTGL